MLATQLQPYGPTPSERQLQWHALETYGFIHFCINTFTDKEWGYGDESPALFNPTAFDADQIVGTAAEVGLKGLVLTCKHHDGFCLWPSQYTAHSVKNSPWKNGEGDMVREFSDACNRHGLKFGVYLSPWDRNHADYGKPAYLEYYRAQLRELLSNYGPVFEVWFDGANGGNGYYGGARETRSIDNSTYYDWDTTWKIVRELQPDACMFSDGGPDIRWCGNESGYAGDPCWATIDAAQLWPGHGEHGHLNRGDRNGTHWLPAEVDVSIRPGWFYHEREDDAVRSVSNLLQIYFESVGRGANLILNLPPDRRGVLPAKDVVVLKEWNQILSETFAVDLAQGAVVTASNTGGEDAQFAPSHVLDHQRDMFWAPDETITTAELILDLGQPTLFNVVRLREYLPLGLRVDSFALDSWQDGKWREFAAATGIGHQRLIPTAPITTSQVRLRITEAAACPAIQEFGLFLMPVRVAEPGIQRDLNGFVTLNAEASDSVIHYSLDGSGPTQTSLLYDAPFHLPHGGIVKACAFLPQEKEQSGSVTAIFTQSKGEWKVLSASASRAEYSAEHAIDENPQTLWIAEAEYSAPAEIIVDMGQTLTIQGFNCLPRQDRVPDGTPDRYEFYVSEDANSWGKAAATGEFSNIKSNRVLQSINFATPVTGRYFRFAILRTVDDAGFAAISEIGVIV
jgi:alpha-L-fucosidase